MRVSAWMTTVAFLLFKSIAWATGGGILPMDTTVTNLSRTFTGPVSFAIGMIVVFAIVMGIWHMMGQGAAVIGGIFFGLLCLAILFGMPGQFTTMGFAGGAVLL